MPWVRLKLTQWLKTSCVSLSCPCQLVHDVDVGDRPSPDAQLEREDVSAPPDPEAAERFHGRAPVGSGTEAQRRQQPLPVVPVAQASGRVPAAGGPGSAGPAPAGRASRRRPAAGPSSRARRAAAGPPRRGTSRAPWPRASPEGRAAGRRRPSGPPARGRQVQYSSTTWPSRSVWTTCVSMPSSPHSTVTPRRRPRRPSVR